MVAKVRRHAAMGAGGMDRYQGTLWSEKLDDKNLTERLVAIWSRENPLFPVHRQHEDKASTPQASTNNVALCCF